jgi:hypothetical protein
MIKRFTLYGSPHSLPTYKVALMLHLSGEPFSFRYVSFQKGMHQTAEFLALSRWGQVPVLLDGDRAYLQSAAIVEHLAETLDRFRGADSAIRQMVREWLYWNVDVLFPPIFNCYGGATRSTRTSPDPSRSDHCPLPPPARREGALGAGLPIGRRQLSLRQRANHRGFILLRRCGFCRTLCVRPVALEKPRRLDRESDGAGGFQVTLRVAGDENAEL